MGGGFLLQVCFGKNYLPGDIFSKVVPPLPELFQKSILAYSEDERPGGEKRPDGSLHKAHSNILSRDNYVAKARIAGNKEYFVRFNVQNGVNESGIHSTMVTNVEVYENPAKSASLPTIHGGR